jgi:hypothetical protein
MLIMKKSVLATVVFVCLTIFAGCISYERQIVPLK